MKKPDFVISLLVVVIVVICGGNLIVLSLFLPNPTRGTGVDSVALSEEAARQEDDARHLVPPSRSFPTFGTPAFEKQCNWTLARDPAKDNNCTILGRPLQNGEGMSSWVSNVVSGFIMAQQAGCQFLMDYGTDVDITSVLEPRGWLPQTATSSAAGFVCRTSNHCFLADCDYARGGGNSFSELRPYLQDVMKQKSDQNLFFAEVPFYRHAYSNINSFVGTNSYKALKRTLGDDFDIETSMACVLERLFELAPTATIFQPDLFSTLLPTLRQPDVFVMTLYVRSGHTEHVDHEEIGQVLYIYRNKAQRIINCALGLEQSLRERSELDKDRPVVWMLVTDSPYLKKWIIESYGVAGNNENKRTILTTQSRGAHTKFKGQTPSTADFAEAFLDWYLIGEGVDAVIADYTGPSFGDTATFRTVRPYYKVPTGSDSCVKVEPKFKW